MKTRYYLLAGTAILFALSLLALQIVGGLEYTSGASDYTRASMIAAMVTVAVLPAFIDAAWRTSKLLAVCLFVGFVAFLAYSLPASIGRIGEVKESKALAATDAAALTAELASVRKTLGYAEPDMERECAGAPEPLPPNGWPECRRKRGTVKALATERDRLQGRLREMGTARLGDTSSQMLAWALAPLGISEETIRKGSGMALPIGLEVVIASLLALAAAAVRKGNAVRPAATVQTVSVPRQPRQDEPEPPRGGGGNPVMSRDDALADLRTLLKAGQVPESQDWLAARWGVTKSCCSKWLYRWETEGELPGNRLAAGRKKTVVA